MFEYEGSQRLVLLYQGCWDSLHLGVRRVSLLKGKQCDVATLGVITGGAGVIHLSSQGGVEPAVVS